MPERSNWTRNQLLIAFSLYCRLPFGQLHQSNREITRFAKLLGRTPSALAMKLSNIASLDPAITSTGRKGLSAASRADKSMWDEMVSDWDKFANHVHAALSEISDTSALDGIQIPEVTSSVDYTGALNPVSPPQGLVKISSEKQFSAHMNINAAYQDWLYQSYLSQVISFLGEMTRAFD